VLIRVPIRSIDLSVIAFHLRLIYVIRNLIITLAENESHTNMISTKSVNATEGHIRISIRLSQAGNFVSLCQWK
jgi:hypothetical protein